MRFFASVGVVEEKSLGARDLRRKDWDGLRDDGGGEERSWGWSPSAQFVSLFIPVEDFGSVLQMALGFP